MTFKIAASRKFLELFSNKRGKRKAIPVQALGFQEVEAPRFQDSQHMAVVRLSALRLPSPPKKYSWYSFLLEAESNPGP
jgi:hypothetical protein